MASKIVKLSLRQQFRSLLFAARFVFSKRPVLAIIVSINELVDRIIPFIVTWLTAQIVTSLPALAGMDSREAAIDRITGLVIVLLLMREGQRLITSFIRLHTNQMEYELSLLSRLKLKEKFAQLPYERYEHKQVHDEFELAERYAGNLGSIFQRSFLSLATGLAALLLALAAFSQFSWQIAVVIFVFNIPILLLELKQNRLQQQTWRNHSVTRRKAWAYDGLLRPWAIKETRLFGLVELVLKRWSHYESEDDKARYQLERQAEKYRLLHVFMQGILEACVLIWIITLIARGTEPIGQFIFVQGILSQYLLAISSVVYAIRTMDSDLEGGEEYTSFMQNKNMVEGSNLVQSKGPHIVFSGVSFSYPGSEVRAVKNLSIDIPYGKHIAIVGENGAGKTTLLKLLVGLFQPSQGSITVDGLPLQEYDQTDWHRHLGVLTQDYMNYSDFTVAESVWFGDIKKTLKDEDIDNALQLARADRFVEILPKGKQTYMSKWMDEDSGTELSGGQQQRLAIARTLFRDPDILILDEPTSAIDAKAEYEIFNDLVETRKNKTTIYISHRFSTVRRADFILVLDNGELNESGSHQELMQQKGIYWDMFTKQAEGYK